MRIEEIALPVAKERRRLTLAQRNPEMALELGRQLLEAALHQGFRRIGYLCGDRSAVFLVDRIAGLLQHLRGAGGGGFCLASQLVAESVVEKLALDEESERSEELGLRHARSRAF